MGYFNEEQELFFEVKEVFIKAVEARFNAKVESFLMNDEHTRYFVKIRFSNDMFKQYTFLYESIDKHNIAESVSTIIDNIVNDLKKDCYKTKFINTLDETDAKYLIGLVQRLANDKYVPNRVLQYAKNVFLRREENKVVLEFYL